LSHLRFNFLHAAQVWSARDCESIENNLRYQAPDFGEDQALAGLCSHLQIELKDLHLPIGIMLLCQAWATWRRGRQSRAQTGEFRASPAW